MQLKGNFTFKKIFNLEIISLIKNDNTIVAINTIITLMGLYMVTSSKDKLVNTNR